MIHRLLVVIYDELIKILFYYIKTSEETELDEKIECKNITGFQISCSKFPEIEKNIDDKASKLRMYQRKT